MHPHVVISVGLRAISKSKPIKRELSTKFRQAKGCSSPDLQLLVWRSSPEKVSSAEAGGGGAGMLGSTVAMEKGVGIICMVSIWAGSQKKHYSLCFSIRSWLYLSKGFFSFQQLVSPWFCSVLLVLAWGQEALTCGLVWRCWFLSPTSSLKKGSKESCFSLQCYWGTVLPVLNGCVCFCLVLLHARALYWGQSEVSSGSASLRMLWSHSYRSTAVWCHPRSTSKNSKYFLQVSWCLLSWFAAYHHSCPAGLVWTDTMQDRGCSEQRVGRTEHPKEEARAWNYLDPLCHRSVCTLNLPRAQF